MVTWKNPILKQKSVLKAFKYIIVVVICTFLIREVIIISVIIPFSYN